MSELPIRGGVAIDRSGRKALEAALAEAVLAVEGVRRLEPNLRTSLRNRRSPGTVTSVPVRIRRDEHGVESADVAVDIATDASRPAVEVADAVQQVVGRVLVEHGLRPGPVEVSVLAVEA